MDDVLHPNLIEELNKLEALINDIGISMLITQDERGKMHSRPMLITKEAFKGDLWFFASATSQMIEELNWNRQVHLNLISPEKGKFVSLSGTGQIVRDPRRAKDLWSPIYEPWFPKGLADPDLILLKVEVDQAEYWDLTTSHQAQVIDVSRFAKSSKLRTPELSEHRKIDLAG